MKGKAWRYLSNDLVNNSIRSFQIATYFYFHNDNVDETGYKKFKGIIFDAVQKPSIKQKIGETYRGYLNRLEEYYTGSESHKKFYKEVFDKPAISHDDWKNTIQSACLRMLDIDIGEVPIKTFVNCSQCDFNEPCYNGNTKRSLLMFKENEYIKELRKGKSNG